VQIVAGGVASLFSTTQHHANLPGDWLGRTSLKVVNWSSIKDVHTEEGGEGYVKCGHWGGGIEATLDVHKLYHYTNLSGCLQLLDTVIPRND